MNFGHLSDYFRAFGWKTLTSVEVDPATSHGHELNSSDRFREILGTVERRSGTGNGIRCRFLYFGEEEDSFTEEEGLLSWYNSRAGRAHRSAEWRLYYTDNAVIGVSGRARTGDFLTIAFHDGSPEATVIVAAAESTAETQLRWLFGIEPGKFPKFKIIPEAARREVDLTQAQILDALGVSVPVADDTRLQSLLSKFEGRFPSSAEFGHYVRSWEPEIRAEDGADAALVAWMEREEFAFRLLERHIVGKRLEEPFKDVDEFVAFSLSVHQRRKSRAGAAFENHLSQVFRAHGLVFERHPRLDAHVKPDFLFPSANQYFDNTFSVAWLTLLGAKTSCKDRWRQVLSEGKRIEDKHLVTLEPAISANQLAEMRENHLQLVVPRPIQSTYGTAERQKLWDVSMFVSAVQERQQAANIVAISPGPKRATNKRRK